VNACRFLTEDLLARVASEALDAHAQAALQRHLSQPCAACLERLEALDDDAFLRVLAGPGAEASPEELERLMAQVAPAAAPRPERRRHAPRWAVRALAALGMVAAAGVGLVVMRPGLNQQGGWQEKSPAGSQGVPGVALRVFASAADGLGELRRLADEEPVGAHEQLFFRFHLQQPAHVWLLVAGESQPLWYSGGALPSGDHEVAAGGQALALRGDALGPRRVLLLVASPERLESAMLEGLALQAADPVRLAQTCPGCGFDSLQVGAP
jgi:hypothetical protein